MRSIVRRNPGEGQGTPFAKMKVYLTPVVDAELDTQLTIKAR
ncbi:hypothetical protein QCM77_30520 [Bradyrhizobium sp. SSUT18]|nr:MULTISPECIES: hypothetical protein [unclassified Bradyrhizobium]MDH2346272.1 hypothetical protein [Bradyrhizobium sp. SSUT77]MDH2404255.1 hypothetical protein [Bradyrhizobium sp. SSUT18]